MLPFTVILGVLMGTISAIAFGLAAVAFIFWLLQGEYPRVAEEMPYLLRSAGIFAIYGPSPSTLKMPKTLTTPYHLKSSPPEIGK